VNIAGIGTEKLKKKQYWNTGSVYELFLNKIVTNRLEQLLERLRCKNK